MIRNIQKVNYKKKKNSKADYFNPTILKVQVNNNNINGNDKNKINENNINFSVKAI